MRGETGFQSPKQEIPKEIGKYKLSPEFMAAILAAMVVVCPACKKTEEEPAIMPGNATVEPREVKDKKIDRPLYDLLANEVPPDQKVIFDKIFNEEALALYVKKFGLQKEQIANFFKAMKNTEKRDKVFDLVDKYCEEEGVPKPLAHAVWSNESGGRSGATSNKGARGIFQVKPDTAAAHGVSGEKLYGLEANIKAGIKELRRCYDKYGQWGLALVAYAGGTGDLGKLLIKTGHLEKKNFYKYVDMHFDGSAISFYKHGNVPNIVDLYTKRPNKESLGYAFRVLSMGKILDAIDWQDGDTPIKIDETKLKFSNLWDSEQGQQKVKELKKAARIKKAQKANRQKQIQTQKKPSKPEPVARVWKPR
ncbi:MAG: lytic transglycosylase domain-containing protein [Patescibacteria group bacterium]